MPSGKPAQWSRPVKIQWAGTEDGAKEVDEFPRGTCVFVFVCVKCTNICVWIGNLNYLKIS